MWSCYETSHNIPQNKRLFESLEKDGDNTCYYKYVSQVSYQRRHLIKLKIKNEELRIKNDKILIFYLAERSNILFMHFTAFSAISLSTSISGHS